MAFFKASDGKRYASRKAYGASLVREQRRAEKLMRQPETVSIPQTLDGPRVPGIKATAKLKPAPAPARWDAQPDQRPTVTKRKVSGKLRTTYRNVVGPHPAAPRAPEMRELVKRRHVPLGDGRDSFWDE